MMTFINYDDVNAHGNNEEEDNDSDDADDDR